MQCKQPSQALWTHLKSELDHLWHLLHKGLSRSFSLQEFPQGSQEQRLPSCTGTESPALPPPVEGSLGLLVQSCCHPTCCFTLWYLCRRQPGQSDQNITSCSFPAPPILSTVLIQQQKHTKHRLAAELKWPMTTSSTTSHTVITTAALVKTFTHTHSQGYTRSYTPHIFLILVQKSRKEFTYQIHSCGYFSLTVFIPTDVYVIF